MGIDVIAADNSKVLNEFVEFPYRLYRDYPHYAPPLRIAVNQLRERVRVAAILDKAHNRFDQENAGFFGFFECINDHAVADALQRARRWVFERGAKFWGGPFNPSTNYECRLLVESFDS